MRRLFVSQDLLDQWAEQGKIELAGNQLRISAENRSFELRPGARFLSLAAGHDSNELVGKVKSQDQIDILGGELYMSSVLLGEDAYDVQPGFLADVADPAAAPAPPPASARAATALGLSALAGPLPSVPSPAGAPEAPRAAQGPEDEKAALAKFLLENLT